MAAEAVTVEAAAAVIINRGIYDFVFPTAIATFNGIEGRRKTGSNKEKREEGRKDEREGSMKGKIEGKEGRTEDGQEER